MDGLAILDDADGYAGNIEGAEGSLYQAVDGGGAHGLWLTDGGVCGLRQAGRCERQQQQEKKHSHGSWLSLNINNYL
jgi:hypothetical protein